MSRQAQPTSTPLTPRYAGLGDWHRGFFHLGLKMMMVSGVTWLLSAVLSFVHADDVLAQAQTITATAREYTLVAIPVPDIANVEQTVQATLTTARKDVGVLLQSGEATPAELAAAFGELGELYHVHHVYAAAEPCYRNAITLAPETFRWVYDMAYLAQQTNQLDKIEENLRRAIELNPDYLPARLRLAGVYIDLNKHDLAEPLLGNTVEIDELRAASLYRLGQIALAREQYEEAIRLLEQALSTSPQASGIRYPLAMAYRELGDIDRAKLHLARHGDQKPEIADPQIDRLTDLLSGSRNQFHRALEAVRTRRYSVAADAFAAALKQEPDNVNARVTLARSLYLSADREGAVKQLQEALRRAPDNEVANFLSGLLADEQGDYETAVKFYRKTLALKPVHAGAHHYLGNVLVRDGSYDEAARHFAEAVKQVPQNTPARLMEVMALWRSGAQHTVVKQRLESLQADHPEQPMLAFVLARLLAASPESEVRDGPRALNLVEGLTNPFMPPEYSETLAMVYAELGRYDEATTEQANAIAAAFATGRFELLPRLEEMSERYRKNEPCRVPWSHSDPMFQPLPVDPSGPFRDYPTSAPY